MERRLLTIGLVLVCSQMVQGDIEEAVSLGSTEVQPLGIVSEPDADFWCTAGPVGQCADQSSAAVWKQACFELWRNKYDSEEQRELRFGSGSCRSRNQASDEPSEPAWVQPVACSGVTDCESAIDEDVQSAVELPTDELPARLVIDLGREVVASAVELWRPMDSNSTDDSDSIPAALKDFQIQQGNSESGPWHTLKSARSAQHSDSNYFEVFSLAEVVTARYFALRMVSTWGVENPVVSFWGEDTQMLKVWSVRVKGVDVKSDFWCVDGEDGECRDQSSQGFWRETCVEKPENKYVPAANHSQIFGRGTCSQAGLAQQGKPSPVRGDYTRMPSTSVEATAQLKSSQLSRRPSEPEEEFLGRCKDACDKAAAESDEGCQGFLEDKTPRRAEPLCVLATRSTSSVQIPLSDVVLWVRGGQESVPVVPPRYRWCAEQACGALVATDLEAQRPVDMSDGPWMEQSCGAATFQRSIACAGTREDAPGWCAAEWCGTQISQHEIKPGHSWGSFKEQSLWSDYFFCSNRTRQQAVDCSNDSVPSKRSALLQFRAPINGSLLPKTGRIEPIGDRTHNRVRSAEACADLCVQTGMAAMMPGAKAYGPAMAENAGKDLSQVTGATCEAFGYSASLEACNLFSTSLLSGSRMKNADPSWQHYEARSALRDQFQAPQRGTFLGSNLGAVRKSIQAPIDCAAMCREGCRGFVFSPVAETCQLKSVGADAKLSDVDGFVFYAKRGWATVPFGWRQGRSIVGQPVWSGAPEEVLKHPMPSGLRDLELIGPVPRTRSTVKLACLADCRVYVALEASTTTKLPENWRQIEDQLHTSTHDFRLWTRPFGHDEEVLLPAPEAQGDPWSGFVLMAPATADIALPPPGYTVSKLDVGARFASDRSSRIAELPEQFEGLSMLVGPKYTTNKLAFFAEEASVVYVATELGHPSGLAESDGWYREVPRLVDASGAVQYKMHSKTFERGVVQVANPPPQELVAHSEGRPTLIFVAPANPESLLESSLPKGYSVGTIHRGVTLHQGEGSRVEELPLTLNKLTLLKGPLYVKESVKFVLSERSTVYVAVRRNQASGLPGMWMEMPGTSIRTNDGVTYDVFRRLFERGSVDVPFELDSKEAVPNEGDGRQGFVLVGPPLHIKCTVAGGGGNAGAGQQCSFPFLYNGQAHSDCIEGPAGPWCSTTPSYQGQWGRCGECPSTFGGFQVRVKASGKASADCIGVFHAKPPTINVELPAFSANNTVLLQLEDDPAGNPEPDWKAPSGDDLVNPLVEWEPAKEQHVCDLEHSANRTVANVLIESHCLKSCTERSQPCKAYQFTLAKRAGTMGLCEMFSSCQLTIAPEGIAPLVKLRSPEGPPLLPNPVEGSLVLQACDDQSHEQYWKLDTRGLLRPVLRPNLFAAVAVRAAVAMQSNKGLGLVLRTCEDGCRDESTSQFEFTDEGLLRNLRDRNFILTASSAQEHTTNTSAPSNDTRPEQVLVSKCADGGFAAPVHCAWATQWELVEPLTPSQLRKKRLEQQKEAALKAVEAGYNLAKDAAAAAQTRAEQLQRAVSKMSTELAAENKTHERNTEVSVVKAQEEEKDQRLFDGAESELREALLEAEVKPKQLKHAIMESQEASDAMVTSSENAQAIEGKAEATKVRLGSEKGNAAALAKTKKQLDGSMSEVAEAAKAVEQTQREVQDEAEPAANKAASKAEKATTSAKADAQESPASMLKAKTALEQVDRSAEKISTAEKQVVAKQKQNVQAIGVAHSTLLQANQMAKRLAEANAKLAGKRASETRVIAEELSEQEASAAEEQAVAKSRQDQLHTEQEKINSMTAQRDNAKEEYAKSQEVVLSAETSHRNLIPAAAAAQAEEEQAHVALTVAQRAFDSAQATLARAKSAHGTAETSSSTQLKEKEAALAATEKEFKSATERVSSGERALATAKATAESAQAAKFLSRKTLAKAVIRVGVDKAKLFKASTALATAQEQANLRLRQRSKAEQWVEKVKSFSERADAALKRIDLHTAESNAQAQLAEAKAAKQAADDAGKALGAVQQVAEQAKTKAQRALEAEAKARAIELKTSQQLSADELKKTKIAGEWEQKHVAVQQAQDALKVGQELAERLKEHDDQLQSKAQAAKESKQELLTKVHNLEQALEQAKGDQSSAQEQLEKSTALKARASDAHKQLLNALDEEQRKLDAATARLDTAETTKARECAASEAASARVFQSQGEATTADVQKTADRLKTKVAQAETEMQNKQEEQQKAEGEAAAAKMDVAAAIDAEHKQHQELAVMTHTLREQQLKTQQVQYELDAAQRKVRLSKEQAERLQEAHTTKLQTAEAARQTVDQLAQQAAKREEDVDRSTEKRDVAEKALAAAQQKKRDSDAAASKFQLELQTQQRHLEQAYETVIDQAAEREASTIVGSAQKELDAEVAQTKDKLVAQTEQRDALEVQAEGRTAVQANKGLDREIDRFEHQSSRLAHHILARARRFGSHMQTSLESQASRLTRKQGQLGHLQVTQAAHEEAAVKAKAESASKTEIEAARNSCTSQACLDRKKVLKEKLMFAARMQVGGTVELLDLSPADVFVVDPDLTAGANFKRIAAESGQVKAAKAAVKAAKRKAWSESRASKAAVLYVQKTQQRVTDALVGVAQQKAKAAEIHQKVKVAQAKKDDAQHIAEAQAFKIKAHSAALDAENARLQDVKQKLEVHKDHLHVDHQRLVEAEHALRSAQRNARHSRHQQQQDTDVQVALVSAVTAAQIVADEAVMRERKLEQDAHDQKQDAAFLAQQTQARQAVLSDAQKACQKAKDEFQVLRLRHESAKKAVSTAAAATAAQQNKLLQTEEHFTFAERGVPSAVEKVLRLTGALGIAKSQTSTTLDPRAQASAKQLRAVEDKNRELQLQLQQLDLGLQITARFKQRARATLNKAKQSAASAEKELKARTGVAQSSEALLKKTSADLTSAMDLERHKQERALKEQTRSEHASEIERTTRMSYDHAESSLEDASTKLDSANKKSHAAESEYKAAEDAESKVKRGVEVATDQLAHAEGTVRKDELASQSASKVAGDAEAGVAASEQQLFLGDVKLKEAAGQAKVDQDAVATVTLERDALMAPLDKALNEARDIEDRESQKARLAKTEVSNKEFELKKTKSEEHAAAAQLIAAKEHTTQAKQAVAEKSADAGQQEAAVLHAAGELEIANSTLTIETQKLSAVKARMVERQSLNAEDTRKEHASEKSAEDNVLTAEETLQALETKKLKLSGAATKIEKLGEEMTAVKDKMLTTQHAMHTAQQSLQREVQVAVDAHGSAKLHAEKPKIIAGVIAAGLSEAEGAASRVSKLHGDTKQLLAQSSEQVSELTEQLQAKEDSHQDAVREQHTRSEELSAAETRVADLETAVKLVGPRVLHQETKVATIRPKMEASKEQASTARERLSESDRRVAELSAKLDDSRIQLMAANKRADLLASRFEIQKQKTRRARVLIEKEFAVGKQHLQLRPIS
eukprot:TRINITY_DN705_c0_g4_i1.p1 TRINITY_DN705_c0_g4~~TRINITY_DN705_c0_g4_i1.p1  ORF type:complete len:3470 (+),score=986.87 TRINITY_DN705_c0_g4_i1:193-10602(+)